LHQRKKIFIWHTIVSQKPAMETWKSYYSLSASALLFPRLRLAVFGFEPGCGGQRKGGTGFLRGFRLSSVIIIPPVLHTSGQCWSEGHVKRKGTQCLPINPTSPSQRN